VPGGGEGALLEGARRPQRAPKDSRTLPPIPKAFPRARGRMTVKPSRTRSMNKNKNEMVKLTDILNYLSTLKQGNKASLNQGNTEEACSDAERTPNCAAAPRPDKATDVR